MVTANLVGASRNAHDVSACGKTERVSRLLVDGLGQGVSILQPCWLTSVKTLGVLDQLNYLVVFLRLEEHAAVWDSHGIQRQIGHAGPRHHQVTRFFNPGDLLTFERVKQVAEIIVLWEAFIWRRSMFFYPVLVIGFGMLRRPNIGIACRVTSSSLNVA